MPFVKNAEGKWVKSELAISSTLGNGIAAAPELVRAAAPERVRVRTAAPVKVKDEDKTFGFDGDTKKSTASNTNVVVATAQESLAGFGFEPTKSNPVVDGEEEFAGFGTSEGTIDTK